MFNKTQNLKQTILNTENRISKLKRNLQLAESQLRNYKTALQLTQDEFYPEYDTTQEVINKNYPLSVEASTEGNKVRVTEGNWSDLVEIGDTLLLEYVCDADFVEDNSYIVVHIDPHDKDLPFMLQSVRIGGGGVWYEVNWDEDIIWKIK